jgi:hypothetical protein
MNADPGRPDPALPPPGEAVPVDGSRRRFARAGVATSVLLGSLVSKPVLGAAPYRCTISGQMSGNASPRQGDGVPCSSLGSSLSFWRDSGSWPSGFVKGALPNSSNCTFNNGQNPQGTVFNGYAGLQATFFFSNSAGCPVNSTSGNAATMLQLLHSTAAGLVFDLGRATVVSLLNYASNPTNYPVSPSMIVAMFNATRAGGTYPVNPTTSWSGTQVLTYLRSLYPAG